MSNISTQKPDITWKTAGNYRQAICSDFTGNTVENITDIASQEAVFSLIAFTNLFQVTLYSLCIPLQVQSQTLWQLI